MSCVRRAFQDVFGKTGKCLHLRGDGWSGKTGELLAAEWAPPSGACILGVFAALELAPLSLPDPAPAMLPHTAPQHSPLHAHGLTYFTSSIPTPHNITINKHTPPPSAVAARELGMHMVYDVAHNIAKEEEHELEGQRWGRGWVMLMLGWAL